MYRHTKLHWIGCHVPAYLLDRVLRSGALICIGSGTTFPYTNSLGVGSMRGPLTCIICVIAYIIDNVELDMFHEEFSGLFIMFLYMGITML